MIGLIIFQLNQAVYCPAYLIQGEALLLVSMHDVWLGVRIDSADKENKWELQTGT